MPVKQRFAWPPFRLYSVPAYGRIEINDNPGNVELTKRGSGDGSVSSILAVLGAKVVMSLMHAR